MRLGRRPYAEVWDLQQELVEKRIAGEITDTLVLCEHDPIVTVGRGGATGGTDSVGVEVREVERGGEATYHGPGQMVAYPIVLLDGERRDVHRFLRDLEEVVIRVLAEVQISASRREDWTGVWIGDRKVCSMGVAVRRWVTWHGLALNIHTDLEAFQRFKPCGLDGDVMTTVSQHADVPPANLLFEVLTVKHFLEVFGARLPEPPAASSPENEKGFPTLPLHPGP